MTYEEILQRMYKERYFLYDSDRRLEELTEYICKNGMWQGTVLDSVKFVFRAYGIDKEVL